MSARTVLISGAGIAGPALAYWLRRGGFAPTLIESAPAPRRGGYVVDFWGSGYDLAERMGLSDAMNRAGFRIREMRVVDAGNRRLAGFGTRVFDELTGGRFVTLRRSDLSRMLFATVENEVEIVFGDEIVSLRDEPGGVEVRFASAKARRFDLVIGADGLHSNVRRLAFGPQDRFEMQLGYCVAAFETQGYRPRDENIYVIYNQPGRMLGRVALNDDRTLFLFVFADARPVSPSDPPAQKALVRERFSDGTWESPRILDALDRTPDFYFDRVSQIKMEQWSKGRVALIGDAAFCISLMGGQGSALAITSAYVMAGELAKAAGRHRDAFSNYETLLRNLVGSKQKAAARFSSAFAPRTRFGLFFRNQVIKACAIPGLSKVAFGRDIVDRLRLPDYRWP